MTEQDQSQDLPGSPEGEQKTSSIELDAFYAVKTGMSRVFDQEGQHIPVTVLRLIPNYISQVKTTEKEGKNAYQVCYRQKRDKLVRKPIQGHLKKANIDTKMTKFAEIGVEEVDPKALGLEVSVGRFTKGSFVDVTGTSKGKGFQGVMKRYNFGGGPATHGSHFHRTPGSIGMCNKPGKVFKNTKLPGRMGGKQQTVQNLQVVEVNTDKGYMLIKGATPGHKEGFLRIAKAIKKRGEK